MNRLGLLLLVAAGVALYLKRKPVAMALNKLSARGLSLLKEHEGFRPQVYKDSAGYDTIGFGHKLLPGESFPNGVTVSQAEQILFQDTMKAQKAIQDNVSVKLSGPQFDALTSLVYNIGAAAFAKSTLLKLLNQGFYAAAAEQFLQWKYAGGKPILLSRRIKEKALFETPQGVA